MLLRHSARRASRARTCYFDDPRSCDRSTLLLSLRCHFHGSGIEGAPHEPETFGSANLGRSMPKTNSVGEQTTGACIGTHYPQLPCDSRQRLPRRGYIGPAELPLCAAQFMEEVSPVFHHRLKPVNKHTTTFALARNIQQP